MPTIKFECSDGEFVEADIQIARCSQVIKEVLEELGEEEEALSLPTVDSAIFLRIITWATYHQDNPPPAEDDENKEKRTDEISSWDAEFLKVDQETVFKLNLAAFYLDIKGLRQLTGPIVAKMVNGKTEEELRLIFGFIECSDCKECLIDTIKKTGGGTGPEGE